MQDKNKFMENQEKSRKETGEARFRKRQRDSIGSRFVGASLATIKMKPEDAKKVATFLDEKKNFLVYCGSPGIGKTYLCSALFEFAEIHFQHYRYWSENDLLKRVRDSFENIKGDYIDTLRFLLDDDFIMLDDIGSAGHTDWREEILFAAIDFRYNSGLPTVITSNLSREEFHKKYHNRIYSRIFSSKNIVIEINDGVDLRQEGL